MDIDIHHSKFGEMAEILNRLNSIALKPNALQVHVFFQLLNLFETYKTINNGEIFTLEMKI